MLEKLSDIMLRRIDVHMQAFTQQDRDEVKRKIVEANRR